MAADSKHYSTQVQEYGSLMISQDVIADIVTNAVRDVKGIVALNIRPGADFADFIGRRSWARGVRVNISQNNEVDIECNICVRFGENVLEVSKTAQKAVINSLEAITGLKISAVHMNVSGIIHQ
jgi:uncharacterized alkaline shock family protein YloU